MRGVKAQVVNSFRDCLREFYKKAAAYMVDWNYDDNTCWMHISSNQIGRVSSIFDHELEIVQVARATVCHVKFLNISKPIL